jgi:pathogenesis-related protein 1
MSSRSGWTSPGQTTIVLPEETPMIRWLFLGALAGCAIPETDDKSPTDDDDGPFAETGKMEGFVTAHNEVRQTVGVPDLSWDSELAEEADSWTLSLAADDCAFEHNFGSPFGENLYWSSFNSDAQTVVSAWASEVDDYDYDANDCAPGRQCGHYTQIVWDETERVGCAMNPCEDASEIWMCVYDPPGNWVGEWPY